MTVIKKIKRMLGICKHEFINNSFSTVKCKKCKRIIYNPKLAKELINKYCNGMIEKGFWNKEETEYELQKRGLN